MLAGREIGDKSTAASTCIEKKGKEMAVSALTSSQVHEGNKTSVRPQKVKALLIPAPAKALAGKELILATKDVVGPPLQTLQQLTQTCGHQECSWKGNVKGTYHLMNLQ